MANNPNHVFSRIHYSHMLYILQRPEEGLAQAKRAYELDPMNPLIQSTYGVALLGARDCVAALSVVEKLVASDADNFLANNVIEPAAFQCGDLDRVFATQKRILSIDKETMKDIEKIYNENGFNAALEEIMRQLEIMQGKDMLYQLIWQSDTI